jgi:pSer/pThr/pTyr-binding forkhead associated (FHA) protein
MDMTELLILNGPEIGRSVKIEEGVKFLGRSAENDIRIDDKTISRKHLKIVVKQGNCFVTDLKSQNGTFYQGKYLAPGRQAEIKEGIPLAIGMTVICLGEGCKEQLLPFLDTVTLIRGKDNMDVVPEDRRKRTRQKKGDLLSKISLILKDMLPLKDMLAAVLDQIFHHMKRIDRGAFILVNRETHEIICKSNQPGRNSGITYSEEVIRRVLKSAKPLVYSKTYTEDGNALLDTLKVLKIESVLCVPLLSGSGLIGAMYLDSLKRPDGFRKDDLLALLDIGQRIAVTVERDRFALEIMEVSRNLSGEKQ